MRKLVTILALCALLLSGCSKSVKEIRVTSFEVVSVTPVGLTRFVATVEAGIDNPFASLLVEDFEGHLKLDGQECLDVSAGELLLEGRCDKTYAIPFEASLSEGFSPFRILPILSDPDPLRLSVDISARASLRSGVGKTFEFKDIPIDKFLKR